MVFYSTPHTWLLINIGMMTAPSPGTAKDAGVSETWTVMGSTSKAGASTH